MGEGGEQLTQSKLPNCEIPLREGEVYIKHGGTIFIGKTPFWTQDVLRAAAERNRYNKPYYRALHDVPIYNDGYITLHGGDTFNTEKKFICKKYETARKKQTTSA